MFLRYHNKRTNRTHEQNQWVLYTDYNSIAIMYACEQRPLPDGPCDPEQRYIWILGTKTTLTEAEEELARNMATSVCILETLNSMKHTHACNNVTM
jgi:hypothetical protein